MIELRQRSRGGSYSKLSTDDGVDDFPTLYRTKVVPKAQSNSCKEVYLSVTFRTVRNYIFE